MKKTYFSLPLVLPLAVALAACTSAAPKPATSLWKISSAQRTLYLASDTQLLKPADYPIPSAITRAFSESGELIVEQIPAPDKKMHALILKLGLLPSGKTLASELAPAQLETVKIALKKSGISYAAIEHLRPWLAHFVLKGKALKELGIDPQQQLTERFYRKAMAQKMPVTPLEHRAQTIKLVAALPQALQVKWLVQSAKATVKLRELRPRIVKAWRDGDTAAMTKFVEKSFRGFPKLYRALVARRNRAWLKTIEARLDSKGTPVFVVVGDGHLADSDNLLALLRADGYSVRQL
jgi:uncharacterized protein YbaP (TraB family)